MIVPRTEVIDISEAVHGAVDRTELLALGIDPTTILDFSASINPFGPSSAVIEALAKSQIDNYPDREATEFRTTLASRLDVPIDCLIAGNGSSELLSLISLAYFRPSDTVLIIGPTYSEYARVSALMGASVTYCNASPESQFEFPSQCFVDSLCTVRPRAVFLCHPNNPTGRSLPVDDLLQRIDEFPQSLFVIDEAYIEFARDASSFVHLRRDNLIVLRSMTKAYGLAGLRLGYAVGVPEVINTLRRVRSPWSVNSLAQAAGIAALNDVDHLKTSVSKLLLQKEWMQGALAQTGHNAYRSETHFFLVPVANASNVRRQLMESKILVRDCSSFGLPDVLRISPQASAENAVFYEAWKRVLSSKQ